MLMLKLPFWMNGQRLESIAHTAERWWDLAESWVRKPLAMVFDAESAPLDIVDLLAFQRNIERLTNEPEATYRLRVKYAFANAKDAGTRAGISRILERLGYPSVGFSERMDDYEWDQVGIHLPDDFDQSLLPLMNALLLEYFPTCRRFLYFDGCWFSFCDPDKGLCNNNQNLP